MNIIKLSGAFAMTLVVACGGSQATPQNSNHATSGTHAHSQEQVAEPTEESEVTTRRRRPLMPYDTTRWIGTDGRPARVVELEPGGRR